MINFTFYIAGKDRISLTHSLFIIIYVLYRQFVWQTITFRVGSILYIYNYKWIIMHYTTQDTDTSIKYMT